MRKRIICSLAIILTLSACSLDEVVALIVTPTAPPTSIPTETATPTVFVTPSRTPTATLVPTFTVTPTLIGENAIPSVEVGNGDTIALPTLYVVPTAVIPTITSAPRTLFGESGSAITFLHLSSNVLFWGYCDTANYIDFDVKVAPVKKLTYVLLFMRLVDKGGNQSTAWGSGAIMEKVSGGNYTYRVRPENIAHYEEFKNAWIEYQVVASTASLVSLGRSPVYQQELTLQKCQTFETDQ